MHESEYSLSSPIRNPPVTRQARQIAEKVVKIEPSRQAPTPRQRVLGAAVSCFAAKGFHGTSMQEVCTEADMSPGALYRHFPSKDAIIEAIAEQERENNRKFFQQLDVTENVLETLLTTGFAWMRDVSSRQAGALCVEVLAEAQRNPRIREIFERNLTEARAALLSTLARARANGEIDPTLDLDVVVTVFMALGDGLLARMPLEPNMTPDRIEPGLRLLLRRMLQSSSAPLHSSAPMHRSEP